MTKSPTKVKRTDPTSNDTALFDRVITILDDARTHISRTVNSAMVIAYWLIGHEIVEEEQKGKKRAEYGKALIDDLSRRLTEHYGKGFSTTNLRYFRQFYLTYMNRGPEIRHPTGGELDADSKRHPAGGALAEGFDPNLSWSQYRALMRVENTQARQFYEQEAIRSCWNKRQLERQINTLLFERLLKSHDKEGVLQLASEGLALANPRDAIKDPYVLEFLGLPESHRFDREIRGPEDNPTLGLILCTGKNDSVVEYVLDKEQQTIFASRYKLELPSTDDLRKLLREWRAETEDQS